jgi:F0F1-type ATP synthase assembly protein I
MTQQRQSFGPGRVLAEVSLIVALPIVGGVIAGLVADNVLGTSPLLVLGGLLLGSLITALVLYRYITANAARLRGTGHAGTGSAGEQRQPDATAGKNSTDDA